MNTPDGDVRILQGVLAASALTWVVLSAEAARAEPPITVIPMAIAFAFGLLAWVAAFGPRAVAVASSVAGAFTLLVLGSHVTGVLSALVGATAAAQTVTGAVVLGRRLERTGWLSATATLTLAMLSWLGWLGFHSLSDQGAGSSEAYEAWRVAGLVLTLAICLYLACRLGDPVPAAVGAVGGLVLVASVDWSTTPTEDANLWAVGVLVGLLPGSAAAAAAIAALASVGRRGPRA